VDDKSFNELLELLLEMIPKINTLLTRHYKAKKILYPMSMEYKKIHAWSNYCILYEKEFEPLQSCPQCVVSRYKVKDDGCEKDNMKMVLLQKFYDIFGSYLNIYLLMSMLRT